MPIDNRHEREQAKWRIFIGSVTFIHFIFAPQTELSQSIHPQLISGFFLLYALLNRYSLKVHPATSIVRRNLNMVMDLGATSLVIGLAGEAGTPLIAIYLWVIMGNGFRYGVTELRRASIIGLAGFASVILFSPFWQQHLFFSSGFLIVLFAIPFYMSKLLNDLHQAVKKAEQANQAKSEFLSHISHDLRTPLNGISGMNEILSESQLSQEQRECCSVIQKSAESLLELIEQLLTQAQLESGQQQVANEPFSLNLLLTDLNALFKKRIEKKGLSYHHQVDSNIPTQLKGDLNKLKQILNNLLSNALKFTEQGKIELRITLCEQENNLARLRFEVNDSGIGIHQNEQGHIFERFQQANTGIRSRYGGTGLGTAIIQENVRLLSGEFGLNSEIGIGSCFWFEVPFEIDGTTATESLAAAASQTVSSSIEDYQRVKNPNLQLDILAADDNELNRIIIEKVLTRAGHNVTLVNDGVDALNALEERPFDLTILDINMENLGGLEVLKNHRFKYPNDHTPMLMLSADATETTINRCLSAGAAYYLTKPLDSKRLLDAINSATLQSHKHSTPTLIAHSEHAFSELPLLNSQTLAELASIDPDGGFITELVQGFQHDGDKALQQVQQALQTPIDFLHFKNSVHALKGNAAELGADKLFRFCQQAEKISLRELHQQKDQGIYTDLEQLYQNTLATYQEHISLSADA